MIVNKKLSKDLSKYKVDLIDSTLYSPYFFNIVDIESEFGYGKNSIILNPNYNVINGKLDILIDIIDSNNEPIYYSISKKALNDKSRIITVNVTDSTINGPALITVIGNTLDGKIIKYNHSVIINKKNITNSDILFIDEKPTITYTEQRKNKYNILYDTDRTLSLSGNCTIERKSISTILYDSTANFKSNLIGRDITFDFNSSTFNIVRPFTTDDIVTYKVKSVINSNYLIIDNPIKLYNQSNDIYFEPHISYNVSYTTSYVDNGTISSKPNIKSYLYIQLHNLKQNSGFIDSIGLFSKSKNSNYETFNLINNSKIQQKDLLIDSTNIDSSYRIGNIKSQTHIDNYISSNNNDVDILYDDSILNNSFYTNYTTNINDDFDVSIGSQSPLSIYKNHYYTIEFDYYYVNDINNSNIELDVVIGGEPIDKNGNYLVVGSINKSNNNRDRVKLTFITEVDADIYPILRIKGGKWYISNISIKSYNEYGFNPEHTYCYIEIPSEIHQDDTEFLIEFYNQNNKKSKYYHQIDRMVIDGSNFYINSRDNLINGTLYIGDDVNKGIQLEQHNGASIIRSYNFNPDINSGFMLYSGSNPITESSHIFSNQGVYMQTDNGRFFDFNNDSLDIDATSVKINGVDVVGGPVSSDEWTTFAYISDGSDVIEGTNGTESIFTITGSHGISGSLNNTTMSLKLEPIYDYKGTFEVEDNINLTTPLTFKQSDGFSGLITRGTPIISNTKYKIVGLHEALDEYITATQYNTTHAIGMLMETGDVEQDILLDGIVYIPGSNFTRGIPLYLSGSGAIGPFGTINYGTYGKIQYIGTALTSNILRFQPGESIMTGSPPPPP